jgi:zinc transport system substrate-binding protein
MGSLTGCSKSPHNPKDGSLLILASSFPTYCLVQELAQDLDGARVESWIPTDISSHDYHLRPQDMSRLRNASLVVSIGLGFEPSLDKALKTYSNIPVFELSDLVEESNLIEIDAESSAHPSEGDHEHHAGHEGHESHSHGVGTVNPHFWLDPVLVSEMGAGIAEELQKMFPEQKEKILDQLSAFQAEMADLNEEIQEATKSIRRKSFLTQHDAFAYFFKRYQLSWSGSMESEVNWNLAPGDVAELLERARQHDVQVVFLERGAEKRPPAALLSDLGVRVSELEAMETGSYQPGIFQSILRQNVETLRQALEN